MTNFTQPADYIGSSTTYPYESKVTNLELNTQYYFIVRAQDLSANMNEAKKK